MEKCVSEPIPILKILAEAGDKKLFYLTSLTIRKLKLLLKQFSLHGHNPNPIFQLDNSAQYLRDMYHTLFFVIFFVQIHWQSRLCLNNNHDPEKIIDRQ